MSLRSPNLVKLRHLKSISRGKKKVKTISIICLHPSNVLCVYYIVDKYLVKHLFYFSRAVAESSPYIEALKKKDLEVIYCYEQHDEIILYQVKTFKNIKLTLVEKEINTANNQESQTTDYGLYILAQYLS